MQKTLFVLLVIAIGPLPASAHHAFSADYEAGNEGTIEGVVTEVIYRNPHARYYLDVTNADGTIDTWDLQTMNLMALGRAGWKKDTLKVGEKVKVYGTLGRNNSKKIYMEVVTFADGRMISPTRGALESLPEPGTDSEYAPRYVASLADGAINPDERLYGEWAVVTSGIPTVTGGNTRVHLSIEKQDGNPVAYIYNGPVPIRIDGSNFEVDFDWASGFDKEFLSTFRGHVNDDGILEGDFLNHGAARFTRVILEDGQFTATRQDNFGNVPDLPPSPVDLSGIYRRARDHWSIEKLNYAMTRRGQQIIEDYLEMDNPNTRCAAPGLVMASGLPYPLEIAHAENYILLIYGADDVRRVYMDGRPFPESGADSMLGFSTGEWQGETLVVTTSKLSPAFMSTVGQPISADASTIEYFYLDDNGLLHGDMWLHDPINYTRPPYLLRTYARSPAQAVITEVDCDPYSFFRSLAQDGKLEEFWSRGDHRR
jgi:hypothetical protein